jgi:2-keto-3-deoxy-L-rhamnonate aldolase RhmA
MEIARNNFKKAIAEGRVQVGLWSSLCSNIVADSGFDWILLDGEPEAARRRGKYRLMRRREKVPARIEISLSRRCERERKVQV